MYIIFLLEVVKELEFADWFGSKTFIMFNECIDNYDLRKIVNTENNYNYSFVLQHPDNTIVKQYQKPLI